MIRRSRYGTLGEAAGRRGPAWPGEPADACNRSYFAPRVEYFASAGYRTLSVDLRGHGESDKPEGPYSIRTFADDVAHVIRKLGVRRLIAVGHSMGGITVLQLGASHPETVDSRGDTCDQHAGAPVMRRYCDTQRLSADDLLDG